MKSRLNTLLLALLLVTTSLLFLQSLQAGDKPQALAKPVKDPTCQSGSTNSTACHSQASRAEALKSYVADQEKLTAKADSTNGVKSCDKPPSKAALMLQAFPAKK